MKVFEIFNETITNIEYNNFNDESSHIIEEFEPLYYLRLEKSQSQQFDTLKEINKFVDNVTKNINVSYRLALYIVLKQAILETLNDKQMILSNLKEMYKESEINRLMAISSLNKQALQKFSCFDEDIRKKIINDFIKDLKEIEFDFYINNNLVVIDEELKKEIINKKYICLKYEYSKNNFRILFLYNNGLVIAIDKSMDTYSSAIRHINKYNMTFIIELIQNEILNYIKNYGDDLNYKIVEIGDELFTIILFLLQKQENLNNKILFELETFFEGSAKFKLNLLKIEERESKFLYASWCPNDRECKEISEKLNELTARVPVNVDDKDIKNLYYFANYYYFKKYNEKALELYEKLALNGIDFAYAYMAIIYNQMKDFENEEKCLEKVKDIIALYKQLTKKECYKIVCDDNIPNILDSKMYGNPYLPIGESYPTNKKGIPLDLLIQINFEDLNMDLYPEKGILEVFVEKDNREPDYLIRYYEDTTLPYQTVFPKLSDECIFFDKNNIKIKFEKHFDYMPIINNKLDGILRKIIKMYNKQIGIGLFDSNDENCTDILRYLIDKIILNYPYTIGGYADYANTDYYATHMRNKESLIKVMSDKQGDKFSINVLISKNDLENKNFANSQLVYED